MFIVPTQILALLEREMIRMNKLFGSINMSYKKVIIFAIVVAIFTAAMLVIPFTIHTSLSNPGTYLESWILFALIIIMNCDKPIEAGLKTFIFFLISQPLIYLLQVPFSSLGWQIFMFYPQWGILTILTFPGAIIAWQIKKGNMLSCLILSVATSYLAFQGLYFLNETLHNFPHNVVSFIYCFALAIILINCLLKDRKNKIIAYCITGLATIASIVLIFVLM